MPQRGFSMKTSRTRRAAWIAAAAVVAIPVLAWATETITYSYDARGRLVKVERTGTVNNGIATAYTLDKADNRTAKTTTGSPNGPPP
jgi:uncharacterized protein RhaS with RHS repeats